MLVVDPTSSCDICLDPYGNEPEREPHIIACGHVFCRRCLRQVTPMKCPMCRKLFLFSDIQKLHVERSVETEKKKKYSLLRRMILTCDSEEEDVAAVRKEVDDFFEQASEEDQHCPLRKTVEILDRLQHAKDRKRHDKKKIRHLEKLVLTWKNFAHQMQLSQSSSSEQKLKELVTKYQQEAESLRAELELRQKFDEFHLNDKKLRKHHSPNPLPKPPRITTTFAPPSAAQAPWTSNPSLPLEIRRHASEKQKHGHGHGHGHGHHVQAQAPMQHVPVPRRPDYPEIDTNGDTRDDNDLNPSAFSTMEYPPAATQRPVPPFRPGFAPAATSHRPALRLSTRFAGNLGTITREVVHSDDDAAYFTCPTRPRSLWMDEVDEALYRGVPVGHYGVAEV
ncbi:hypothetical protein D9758_009148 [Tetrapyrgos nigripes]|uniref:RING-type domain-containing protein n=1 Tax=Tetrapyrgos nigripes TaxID=182062 RepID=A0A8H5G8K4_9AGAR|nr:hypothetical protein D9758_009148 [Tetrapyrgos nigripes]